MYNKSYIFNYTAKYICFINATNESSLLYINYNQVQYKAFNSLVASNLILNQVSTNYQVAATWYILNRVLKYHFALIIRKQKHDATIKVMLKFFNKPIPLKHIQYPIKKADFISFLILLLNKDTISKIVNILYALVERLGLASIVENKIVSI